FRLARKPPSRRYPYGYHRAEDVAGLVIVAFILVSAVVAGIEAIQRLIHPQGLTSPGLVLAAGFVGFAGNEAVAAYRVRIGRRIGSAALVADGLHARVDGLASLGVVVATIGVLLGFDRADALVGLAARRRHGPRRSARPRSSQLIHMAHPRRARTIADVDPRPVPPPPPVIEHCYRHPDVETGVHCTRCGRPICTDCMYPAPVGHQ